MTSGKQIINRFEDYAPLSLAWERDPSGLQLGNPERTVKTVLVTLDVRPEVVEEAEAVHADMIFSHHPAMFRPVHNLDLRVPQNAMYAQILKDDLLVYSAHTNLDRVQEGMNDWLAEALGLSQVVPFINEGEGANMGRIGLLPEPVRLEAFVEQVKAAYNVKGLRVIARDLDRQVQRVAILGGDGGDAFNDAKEAGADVFITGDVYYHTGHDMLAADLPVIDPGHHIEAIMKGKVAALINEWAAVEGWDVKAIPSKLSTDPFTFM
ncbi:Nif3-like dinuclear metal center hexameric protein [Lacticaseibacillus parahuelsenbergensis]|uniref:GTP cyclohydrolase 1 type 2 homolog n=1 Tax=Lacticaseibacillus parahuelsenbergensis TaxID=3068305 RepID=A0ABY9L6T0_9LACO|nr:Nif3-like dinuclear metal center hexameric protein [Lacticaseibacillus sp. NCIMB 15471]WLV79345.1 Nif3-like dinuclear metal center hexameric protein [Lacticaseibacillus sp. NCIMB 15471]